MSLIKEMNDGPLTAALALLPDSMDSARARVLVLTIGLQESNLTERRQRGNGPARGLHQFEQGGGVKGVLTHASTKKHARLVTDVRGVAFTPAAVWEEMEHDDVLDMAMARLLLWSDPKSLPQVGDAASAWALYLRTWRPGAHTRGDTAIRNKLWLKFKGHYDAVVSEIVT